MNCARCAKPLEPASEAKIPPLLRAALMVAFAVAHVGAFAGAALSGPFCAPCRGAVLRRAVPAALAVVAAGCAAAVLLFRAARGGWGMP